MIEISNHYCPVCFKMRIFSSRKPEYSFKRCKVCNDKLECYSHNYLLYSFSHKESFKEYYCDQHDQLFRVNSDINLEFHDDADRICHNCCDDKQFLIKLIEFEYLKGFNYESNNHLSKHILLKIPTIQSDDIPYFYK